MIGKALVLALCLLLTGCSEPTIDGSSERAFHESAATVANALPPADRQAFTEALLFTTMYGIDFGVPLAEGEQLDLEGAIARLDGMTAEEIMSKADELGQNSLD